MRRPWRSERVPIRGDAMAWRRLRSSVPSRDVGLCGWAGVSVCGATYEKRLPMAPPSRTMSYLESMGRSKAALYLLRYEITVCSRLADSSSVIGAEASWSR